jgi:hypothetical protein
MTIHIYRLLTDWILKLEATQHEANIKSASLLLQAYIEVNECPLMELSRFTTLAFKKYEMHRLW